MKPGLRMKLMAGAAQPNHQVGTEQRMAEEREYRGNRRSQAPWSDDVAEMRYRGEDGRYKSGTRRATYDEPMGRYDPKRRWEVSVEPRNYQVTEPGKEHLDPYEPHGAPHEIEDRYMGYRMDDDYDDPSGRVIGFGSPRNHYGMGKAEGRHQRGSHSMKSYELDRETAEHWVSHMKNEDQRQPNGGKWEPDFLKTMAQKLGIPTEGEEFWEFYAMTNAMYSDNSEVLKKYNVTNPMCFAELAKAWMNDKDAVEDKTMVYYNCIVKPKLDEGA